MKQHIVKTVILTAIVRVAAVLAWAVLGTGLAQGGAVEIVEARARASGSDLFSFSVTLKHGDTGWDHFANKWEVVGPDGTVLGTRPLAHPHVNEQPFTRSLGGVNIPEGITKVTIRAYDKVHGLADKTVTVKLPGRE